MTIATAAVAHSQLESLADWLPDLLAQGPDAANDTIYGWLCPPNPARFKIRLARLERLRQADYSGTSKEARSKRAKRDALVGKCFEHLVRGVFSDSAAVKVTTRLRTTTSEVDFLLEIQPMGSVVPLLRKIGSFFVGEAKCHASGVKSEWINEMRGFLDIHNCKHGILFVASPSKKVGATVRTAIALNAAQGVMIVPFGWKQLFAIRDGANALRVLSEQHAHAAIHDSTLEV